MPTRLRDVFQYLRDVTPYVQRAFTREIVHNVENPERIKGDKRGRPGRSKGSRASPPHQQREPLMTPQMRQCSLQPPTFEQRIEL